MPAPGDRKAVPRLPLAPRPFRDELLTSWFARVACRYGHEAREFRRWLWSRAHPADGISEWRATAETEESVETIALWAHAARLDPERLRRLTLARRYPGRAAHWFLQAGPPGRPSRRRSPPICPSCLAEDAGCGRDAYLRAAWMLAERCACPRHQTFLIDRCPACGHALGSAFRIQAGRALLVCGGCGKRLDAGARPGRGGDPALIALLRGVAGRIGRGLRQDERWRANLESTIALLWAPLDRAGAARPVLSLDFPDGWRWSIGDRQQVAHPNPLARLSIIARIATLRALGERFDADMERETGAAAPWRLRAAAVGRARRQTRAGASPPAAPGPLERFRTLAGQILAHPDWIAARRLPAQRRRALEARIMDRALRGALGRNSDGRDGARSAVQ